MVKSQPLNVKVADLTTNTGSGLVNFLVHKYVLSALVKHVKALKTFSTLSIKF